VARRRPPEAGRGASDDPATPAAAATRRHLRLARLVITDIGG
jgi:hypothetical protein